MHPARKFSQNSCKNKSLNIRNPNKENKDARDAFSKKYSIGNHLLSEQCEIFPHKKSIAEEKISVCLDQTQNKTYAFSKRNLDDNEIKYLNMVLQNSNGSLCEVLSKQLGKDIHSKEMKKLLCTLLEKIQDEKESEDISIEANENIYNFQLHDPLIRPYLEQQLFLLEKNLDNLRKRQQQFQNLSKLNKSEKTYLLQTLKQLEQQQQKQLQLYSQVSLAVN